MRNHSRHNVNRINSKSAHRFLSPRNVLLIGVIVWALVMADIYIANQGSAMVWFLMLLFTVGIFGFVYFYARPGRHGADVYEYGFFHTLFHGSGSRNQRNQRRRRKQMQHYRR